MVQKCLINNFLIFTVDAPIHFIQLTKANQVKKSQTKSQNANIANHIAKAAERKSEERNKAHPAIENREGEYLRVSTQFNFAHSTTTHTRVHIHARTHIRTHSQRHSDTYANVSIYPFCYWGKGH